MSEKINYIRLTTNDETRWNNLLMNSINSSYRASMGYVYSKEKFGRKNETYIFSYEEEDVAGVHYSTRKSSLGIFKTGDIISGILFKNEPKERILDFILDHFSRWGEEKGVSYLRFSPWLPYIIEGEETGYFCFYDRILKEHGFIPISEGRNTYWLDLRLSEDQLLANMRRKTRYYLKRAINSLDKIQIQEVLYPDAELISTFWEFYNQLGKNKNFIRRSEDKFRSEVRTLLETGFATLFVVKYNNEIVNISMASKGGIASYMYGAINPEYIGQKDLSSPGYYAQWGMIKASKRDGFKIYDLGFCPGPIPVKSHPAFDIWHFKYGFGGKHVRFMPTYGKIIKPLKGKIFQLLKYN